MQEFTNHDLTLKPSDDGFDMMKGGKHVGVIPYSNASDEELDRFVKCLVDQMEWSLAEIIRFEESIARFEESNGPRVFGVVTGDHAGSFLYFDP